MEGVDGKYMPQGNMSDASYVYAYAVSATCATC